MKIEDFKELTNFVNDEADKFFETYGEKLVVSELVVSLVKNLNFYFKLEAGYLRRKEKRELKLKEAIETMPHNFIWKLFHYDVWRQIKAIKAEEDRLKKEVEERAKKDLELNKAGQNKQEVVEKKLEPITAVVAVKEQEVEVIEPN